MDPDNARSSIQGQLVPLPDASGGVGHAQNGGYAQCAGDDRVVGGSSAQLGDEAQDLPGIDSQEVGGRQIVGHQDHGGSLLGRERPFHPHQVPLDVTADLADVVAAVSQVFVIDIGKLRLMPRQGVLQRGFGVPAVLPDGLDGFPHEHFVHQDHEVRIQDEEVFFADLVGQSIARLPDLGPGLLEGPPDSRDLLVDLGRGDPVAGNPQVPALDERGLPADDPRRDADTAEGEFFGGMRFGHDDSLNSRFTRSMSSSIRAFASSPWARR